MALGTAGKRNGKLRVLLTNGRLPVALDLARQLHRAGHTVFVVDPVPYHGCKLSNAVRKSRRVPGPHDDPIAYIREVKAMVAKWRIDCIIPIHDEVFYLADSEEPEILNKLFAPSFELLVRLHDKWEFHRLLKRCGMDAPATYLCKSMNDVRRLPLSDYDAGMALKPCFSGTSTGLYHLEPNGPLPEEADIGGHNWHVAQEWISGKRYCSYSIVRRGRVAATGVYPVVESLDGNTSVSYEQQHHPGIYKYIETLVSQLGNFDGQLSFDFIELDNRLVATKCSPRSTSGLHLWTGTIDLAHVITDSSLYTTARLPIAPPKINRGIQVTPGIMIGRPEDATVVTYARHVKHLLSGKDIIWSCRDMMPAVLHPLLLAKYYQMCHETGLELSELFQLHSSWEPLWDEHDPEGCQLGDIRRLMLRADKMDEKDEMGTRSGMSSTTGSDLTLFDKELSISSQATSQATADTVFVRRAAMGMGSLRSTNGRPYDTHFREEVML